MVEIIETSTPFFAEDLKTANVHLVCGDFTPGIKPKGCQIYQMIEDGEFTLDVMAFSWKTQLKYEVRTLFPTIPLTIIPTLGEYIVGKNPNPYPDQPIEWIYNQYLLQVFKIQQMYQVPRHMFFDFSQLYGSLARTELYKLVYESGIKIKAERIEVLV